MKGYIALLFIFYHVYDAFCCSCPPNHLQRYFCQSDYVVHAVPISETSTKLKAEHQLFIVDILQDVSQRLKEWDVITVTSVGTCKTTFELFKSYIIGGGISKQGELSTGICRLMQQWSSLSTCEIGILHKTQGYGKPGYDCSCGVNFCFDDPSDPNRCKPKVNECLWNLPFNQTKDLGCQRDSQNVCGWTTC